MTIIYATTTLEPQATARWEALMKHLRGIAARHPDAVLASSLAAEDMVLTHAIYDSGLPLEVFTLDTGRLHKETLGLLDDIQCKYGRSPTVHEPDARTAEMYARQHGELAFYDSLELREACCQTRKVE